jgi:hypothetical protein
MTVRTMTNTVRRREVSENVRREVRVRIRRSRIEKDSGDSGDSGDNNVERERTVRTGTVGRKLHPYTVRPSQGPPAYSRALGHPS